MKPLSLVRTFITGVLAILPLVVTVAVVIWLGGMLFDMLGPEAVAGRLLRAVGLRFVTNKTTAYAVGWCVVLAGVFGLGLLVELGARRFFEDRVDALAKRVPVFGSVYGAVRQFVGLMEKKGAEGEFKGMSVVFCLFGGDSGAAFLALLPTPERFRVGDIDCHAVLVPTAPFPFGGSLIYVPVNSVKPANMTVDAFMSIYVSMGVTGPKFLPTIPKPTHALPAETKPPDTKPSETPTSSSIS